MAKLEEIRKWARGKKVKGLPEPIRRNPVRKPQLENKIVPVWVNAKYSISAEGDDALLLFGKFRGNRVSELINTARGRSYLKWIMKREFQNDLKEVCRYRLELRQRERNR